MSTFTLYRIGGWTAWLAITLSAYGQGQLTTIDVTPASVSMEVGQQRLFTATGKDQDGVPCPIPNPHWTINGPGGVTPSGTTCTYTAVMPGTFTILCRDSATAVIGTGTVHVASAPPILTTIDVTPASVSMEVGQQRLFTATGKDQYGDAYAITNPVWSSSSGGTFTPAGASCEFTATQPGIQWLACLENGTPISGTTTVSVASTRIAPGPAPRAVVFPSYPTTLYTLQSCANLKVLSNDWWNVPGCVLVRGIGGLLTLNDTNLPAGTQRFYRLAVEVRP